MKNATLLVVGFLVASLIGVWQMAGAEKSKNQQGFATSAVQANDIITIDNQAILSYSRHQGGAARAGEAAVASQNFFVTPSTVAVNVLRPRALNHDDQQQVAGMLKPIAEGAVGHATLGA